MSGVVKAEDRPLDFSLVQGRSKGRAGIVKVGRGGGVIQTDCSLELGKQVVMVRQRGGETGRVQLVAEPRQGLQKKGYYLLSWQSVFSPDNLLSLLAFLQTELGVVTRDPRIAAMSVEHVGPVRYRFETGRFEVVNENLEQARQNDKAIENLRSFSEMMKETGFGGLGVIPTRSSSRGQGSKQEKKPDLFGLDPDEMEKMGLGFLNDK